MLRIITSRSRFSNTDRPQSAIAEEKDSQMAVMKNEAEDNKEERSTQIQNQSSDKLISPWALHANEQLSPLSSVWLYLASVSLMCLGTCLVIKDRGDVGVERNDSDTLFLAIFSTCFSVSFAIALGYRHRSLRNAFTCELRSINHSIEFILSIILFCLWCVVMRLLLDPFSAMNFAVTTVETTGKVNIWACAWLGYGILSYLVGSLLLVSPIRKRGTWLTDVIAKTKRHRYEFEDSRSTFWFMFLAFQVALSAFSIELIIVDGCSSSLGTTSFCKRSRLGACVGLTNAIISCAALLLSRLYQMGKCDNWESKKIWQIESFLSLLAFTLSCFNLGFSTTPGGPGAELGNMFVTSMVGVALSLMLCEQSLDSCVLRVCTSEEEEDSESKLVIPPEEQVDLEMGKKRIFTPRLQPPDDGSSSSRSSPEALRESIYPSHFGHGTPENSSHTFSDPVQPLTASKSSTKVCGSSSCDESHASGTDLCSLSVNHGTVNSTDYESGSDSDSGVDLCFQPDDDVSSIDCSIPSKVASQLSRGSSIDPDGYKSEDNYDARETKLLSAQIMQLRMSKRKKNKSNKFNRSDVLEPVAEQQVDQNKSAVVKATDQIISDLNLPKRIREEHSI